MDNKHLPPSLIELNQEIANYAKDQTKAGTAKFHVFEPKDIGSPEWCSWDNYLKTRLGFEFPSMARLREGRQKAVTVPTQWPQWFDPSYTVRNIQRG